MNAPHCYMCVACFVIFLYRSPSLLSSVDTFPCFPSCKTPFFSLYVLYAFYFINICAVLQCLFPAVPYIMRNSSLNCKRGWKGELEFLKRWLQKLWKFRRSRKCYKCNSVHLARQTPKMCDRTGWFMCHLAHHSWMFYVLETLSETVLKLLSKVRED